jgi:hypothetical protein
MKVDFLLKSSYILAICLNNVYNKHGDFLESFNRFLAFLFDRMEYSHSKNDILSNTISKMEYLTEYRFSKIKNSSDENKIKKFYS